MERIPQPPSDHWRAQAFVSHATADGPIVQWVAAQLRALRIRPYLAEDDPQPGSHLSEKVREAIASSDAMLVLLTKRGMASHYVHQEIGSAHQANKPILAFVERGLERESLALLDGTEYVVFDPDDLASSSADVISALSRVGAQRGFTAPPRVVMTTEPALQLQLSAQLQLTPGQLLLGLLIVTAAVGLVFVATSKTTGASPTA